MTTTVFIVSDSTAITAETFAHSVLSMFDHPFQIVRMPFIDQIDKAHEAVQKINAHAQQTQSRPIVFITLVDDQSIALFKKANALVLDMFDRFLTPIEQELNISSDHKIGKSHQNSDSEEYKNRIDAINFSLAHDDGQSNRNLDEADIILIGVSRSGKTPTTLYLAMQYGLKVANYPLIPEDFERNSLPSALIPYKKKCYGLTIDPKRLSEIRNERRPGSKYASLENCRYEVNEAEQLMKRENVPWLSSTHKSIEEISSTILQEIKQEKNTL